jgi:hypothetical protein
MMMSKGPFLRILAAGVLLASWAAADTSSNAASGLEVNPIADGGCFETLWGEKVNNCSTTQTLLIPMERQLNGDHTVQVRYHGNGVSATTCRPIVQTQGGDEIWYDSLSWTNTSWVWSTWSGFVHLPTSSMWFMDCWIAGTSGNNKGTVLRVLTDS